MFDVIGGAWGGAGGVVALLGRMGFEGKKDDTATP